MQSQFTYGAATLALLVSVTCALAQSPATNTKRDSGAAMPPPPSAKIQTQIQAQIGLSADQKQAIWDSVGKNKGAKAPANFQASVGANVPAQIALRPLPSTLSKQVPDAKKYRYAKIADEVVLVDPSTHKVIDIIKQ
jgi:Spy/CpxP family protein refolding chaperone